jgi:hypothetical protein
MGCIEERLEEFRLPACASSHAPTVSELAIEDHSSKDICVRVRIPF